MEITINDPIRITRKKEWLNDNQGSKDIGPFTIPENEFTEYKLRKEEEHKQRIQNRKKHNRRRVICNYNQLKILTYYLHEMRVTGDTGLGRDKLYRLQILALKQEIVEMCEEAELDATELYYEAFPFIKEEQDRKKAEEQRRKEEATIKGRINKVKKKVKEYANKVKAMVAKKAKQVKKKLKKNAKKFKKHVKNSNAIPICIEVVTRCAAGALMYWCCKKFSSEYNAGGGRTCEC